MSVYGYLSTFHERTLRVQLLLLRFLSFDIVLNSISSPISSQHDRDSFSPLPIIKIPCYFVILAESMRIFKKFSNMFSKLFKLSFQCFARFIIPDTLSAFYSLLVTFLCFSAVSAHSFINLLELRITYWKLLLFLLIVISDSWLFIRTLKKGKFWLSHL